MRQPKRILNDSSQREWMDLARFRKRENQWAKKKMKADPKHERTFFRSEHLKYLDVDDDDDDEEEADPIDVKQFRDRFSRDDDDDNPGQTTALVPIRA